jgi:cellulose biosynthesis protein BcsQ
MARGLRTLVIDLDPSANASIGLGQTGEFKLSSAEVVKKPKNSVVSGAILASLWAKGQTGILDIMVSQPRIAEANDPNPSFKQLWNLDEALSHVHTEYDLVLIDTPPNLNALSRMAWVASDRVMLVTEPSINSVLAVESGIRAFQEIRKKVNRQVAFFGIVVNRLRPTLAEHQYRMNELEEIYPGQISSITFEEKSALAQAQGAGRSIHSWPGQSAAKLASNFDALLKLVTDSFASDDLRRLEQPNSARDRSKFAHRSREVGNTKSHGRRSADNPLQPKPERIEMVEHLPVSDEFKDRFEQTLRQTMTEKQIRALTQQEENEGKD